MSNQQETEAAGEQPTKQQQQDGEDGKAAVANTNGEIKAAMEALNKLEIVEEDGEEKNGKNSDDDELKPDQQKQQQDEDGTETAKDGEEEANGKGNEEKKIFCGGISYDTNDIDLNTHFTQFGPVKEAQVKYDRMTGRSRGFAFVEFETVDGCKASLAQREQMIKGKQCEVKPAKTRELGYMNKKIFVGGLPGDFPEEELRKHFEQFGPVEDVEWPFDKLSKARKNFAFVVFETEEAADRAAASSKQQFANRECDVKKAVPQNKRSGGMFQRGAMPLRGGGHGQYNGAGGGMGGGGMRGSGGMLGGGGGHQNQMPMYQNAAAWYQMNANAAAWYNAAYNGGPWYPTAPGSSNANNAASAGHQWYNQQAGTNNPVAAAQAAAWGYGNWYNNGGNNASAASNAANGDINGTA